MKHLSKLLPILVLVIALAYPLATGAKQFRPKYIEEKVELRPAEKSHWMTRSSKKRHNNNCRYFGKTKGIPCSKYEGIACKICGG